MLSLVTGCGTLGEPPSPPLAGGITELAQGAQMGLMRLGLSQAQ